MASAKSVLEKMIAAMNRGGDAAILKAKDIETFAKPRPKKKPRALKKSNSSSAKQSKLYSEEETSEKDDEGVEALIARVSSDGP
jgi:hypothetical protein